MSTKDILRIVQEQKKYSDSVANQVKGVLETENLVEKQLKSIREMAEASISGTGVTKWMEDLAKQLGTTKGLTNLENSLRELTGMAGINVEERGFGRAFAEQAQERLRRVSEEMIAIEPISYSIPDTNSVEVRLLRETINQLNSQIETLNEQLGKYHDRFLQLQDKIKPKSSKRGRINPNLDTPRKLRDLIALREDAIKRNIDIPAWSTACKLAGIDHKTALHHLRELRENWDVRTYHWAGEFGESRESGES